MALVLRQFWLKCLPAHCVPVLPAAVVTHLFVQLPGHPGCANQSKGEKKKIIIFFSVELVSVNPNWGVQAVMLIDVMQRMMTGVEKRMEGLPKQL